MFGCRRLELMLVIGTPYAEFSNDFFLVLLFPLVSPPLAELLHSIPLMRLVFPMCLELVKNYQSDNSVCPFTQHLLHFPVLFRKRKIMAVDFSSIAVMPAYRMRP
jgi:hypothetical protein